MKRLSICLVSTFYPPESFGGDAVQVHRLATGLARRGHRVRVVHNPVAYRMLAGESAHAVGHDRHPDVEVIPLTVGRLAVAGTYLTGEPAGYRRELLQLVGDGFDVVHFHNPSLLGGPGALGLGPALKLYTAHEHWLLCPTHVLYRYGREVCHRRTCWRCTASYRRPPQLWRSTGLLERSVDQLDLLICPSAFTARLHREFFPSVPIEVLAPFFSPEPGELEALPRPVPRTRPYFAYAGRLEPIKGVDSLVRSFLAVRGADLLIVGDGDQARSLRELAAGAANIVFCGRRRQSEVLALFRDALAVVIPSAGYETFGGVAMEAMAAGTPVVVRDLGPLPELVAGGGGWVFADDRDLTTRLQALTDHPESAMEAGRVAGDVFRTRWDSSVLFERYFQLIATAAERAGRDALAGVAGAAARCERDARGQSDAGATEP